MECLLSASRLKRLSKEEEEMGMTFSGQARKLRLEEIKKSDQQRFKRHGIYIDFPDKKVAVN